MKKKLLYATLLGILLPIVAQAQGWPAGYGGVMLQGFFWDSWTQYPLHSPYGGNSNWMYTQSNDATAQQIPGYTWATMYGAGWGDNEEWQVPLTTWASLLTHKDEVAPYIDLLWLPQSGSTICPETSVYYKNTDNSGRNGVRAWRRGNSWDFSNGSLINNPDCMGFVPVFYFHHGEQATPWTYTYYFGENNQEHKVFTPKSYFGTEAELRQLISAYHDAGTGAIEDVVANHRGCFGTWDFDFVNHNNENDTYHATKANLDFPSEEYTGQFANLGWDEIWAGQTQSGTELIEWTKADVCSDDESLNAGGNPSGGPDCGGQGEWARDIQHHNKDTRAKVVKYLDFLKNNLGYVGFRYDYAMGFEGIHYGEYNTILRPTFSVGEYWGAKEDISGWITSTTINGENLSAAFDFPLMYAINGAFNNGNFKGLKDAGLIGDHDMRRYTVTFVENHDTFKDLPTDGSNPNYGHRTTSNILEANAFILAMPGTPCLFWPHFMHPEWHDQIVKMIKARRTAGVNNMSEISYEDWGSNGVKWIIEGTNGSLCLILGDGSKSIPEGYSVVWQSDGPSGICSFCINDALANSWQNNVKAGLVNGYPIVSQGTCTFNGSITINVKPSESGVTLVYTTDGTEPTTSSPRITGSASENFTFTATTTLKVGVVTSYNNVESVQSVQTYTYAENGSDADQLTIYVKADDAPNLYLWNGDNKPNGAWAGNKTTETKTVGGVLWHCKTFDKPSSGEYYNLIINWDGASQSHTITGINSDRYFTYYNGQPIDVTKDYIGTALTLTADKESGIYDGDMSVNVGLTASIGNVTIVYTLDGSEPNINSPQVATTSNGKASVKISGEGEHVLRAGILKDGQVINLIARNYIIQNTQYAGTRIFVRSTRQNAPAPYLYIFDVNGTTPSEYTSGYTSWSGKQLTQTVQDEDGYTWYYVEFPSMNSCSAILNNGSSGTSNQTADITGLSGDVYLTWDADNRYMNVTGLKSHKSFVVFEPSKSTWDKDGALMRLYIAGVGDQLSFEKIGSTNGANNVYKWSSNSTSVNNGTEICFKRMSTDGNTQWDYSSSNNNHPRSDKAYQKGGYYYNDLNQNSGWTNSVEISPDVTFADFKYPGVSHKIDDITEASLCYVENEGISNKYYTINEDLTVGYVDKANKAVYAFNASVDADLVQHPNNGLKDAALVEYVDYVNLTWNSKTMQRNWVKITGYEQKIDYDTDFTPGDVLSNVTGKLIDDVNTNIEVVVEPIKKRSGDNPEFNVYTPCSFASSQTQTSSVNGKTYFFYRPQVNEVANIYSAVYKGVIDGNTVFEMPPRTYVTDSDNPDNNHWVNGAGLEGCVVIDLSGVPNLQLTSYNIGDVVDFVALITRNANGGASGAPRRAGGDSYNIKAISAEQPHGITTGVTEVKHGGKVTGVYYVNLAGMVSDKPFSGINVVVTTYDDGSRTTRKAAF